MIDEMRVQELLDELHDSHATPEEVCKSYPELLPEVRERWLQVCRIEDELDDLFPPLATPQNVRSLPRIPNYEVESILGHGGMGVVFLARHLRLNRRVALKMAGTFAGPRERERFQREAEAVAALRHPNIVQIHDFGDIDGQPYFTMEYIEGGSLARKLAGAPQPAREAAAMLAALAEAVQVAHASGIIHRDLKPANVLLTAEGITKISDFGLARRLDGEAGLTRSGTAVGTPSYMAPEQALGKPLAVGPAVDIYALGAILYEMLTGRPPFRAETAAGTVQQVITQEPVPPSRLNGAVPRDLEIICLKCLHKEPRLRYASAAALTEDLHRFLRGEAIAARPEGPLSRLIRRIRRRPALSTAMAISALLTAVLIGGGVWMLSERAIKAQGIAATERAVDEDLTEMESFLRRSSWLEAKAARERAKGRLGELKSEPLLARLDQGRRDLEFVEKLETVRLDMANKSDTGEIRPEPTARAYAEAFSEAGIEQSPANEPDNALEIADRIRASNIAAALLAAFDHWSALIPKDRLWCWILKVASTADTNSTGWRKRARDPEVRRNPAALLEIMKEAPFAEESVSLLMTLDSPVHATKPERIAYLSRIQDAHPGDFWANFILGNALSTQQKPMEAIRYFQAATAIRPHLYAGYQHLGQALNEAEHFDEAIKQFEKALAIDPAPGPAHAGLAYTYTKLNRHREALAALEMAMRYRPDSGILHFFYAANLLALGNAAEAIIHGKIAMAKEPKSVPIHHDLYQLLLTRGQLEPAREAWQKWLEFHPSDHSDWYGYAELCLYLGREEDYIQARRALLAQFGASTNPYIAERASRACLLLPVAGEDLRRAAALAAVAAAVDREKNQGAYPYFQFVMGLAEYRRGRFDRAIEIMRGDASQMFGPASRLVLAMALHRSGQNAEARKSLAAAILAHDWRPRNVRDQDGWIAHVLRREAESMILPNLPAFLEGKYQPLDNDERLAFVGVCQFTNRTVALARLYADTFYAWAAEGIEISFGYRYNAARAAALAGCGRGTDAAQLDEAERAKLRQQARQWLRADLAALSKALKNDPSKNSKMARKTLLEWLAEPDFTGLRDQPELQKLHENERKECQAIWDEINRQLKDTTLR